VLNVKIVFLLLVSEIRIKIYKENLESLICENMPISARQISISCQTTANYKQPEKDLKVELENQKKEIDGLAIKSKEAEVDLLRKDLIIQGISEKVNIIRNVNNV
jgi:hypothetical protein